MEKKWTIPVTWEVCGTVEVLADTLENAMQMVADTDGYFDDLNISAGEQIEGSGSLTFDSSQSNIVREVYNRNQADEVCQKKRTLEVTVNCKATYNSSIEVPAELSISKAIQYAQRHLDLIPIATSLEYMGGDVLDTENCNFSPDE